MPITDVNANAYLNVDNRNMINGMNSAYYLLEQLKRNQTTAQQTNRLLSINQIISEANSQNKMTQLSRGTISAEIVQLIDTQWDMFENYNALISGFIGSVVTHKRWARLKRALRVVVVESAPDLISRLDLQIEYLRIIADNTEASGKVSQAQNANFEAAMQWFNSAIGRSFVGKLTQNIWESYKNQIYSAITGINLQQFGGRIPRQFRMKFSPLEMLLYSAFPTNNRLIREMLGISRLEVALKERPRQLTQELYDTLMSIPDYIKQATRLLIRELKINALQREEFWSRVFEEWRFKEIVGIIDKINYNIVTGFQNLTTTILTASNNIAESFYSYFNQLFTFLQSFPNMFLSQLNLNAHIQQIFNAITNIPSQITRGLSRSIEQTLNRIEKSISILQKSKQQLPVGQSRDIIDMVIDKRRGRRQAMSETTTKKTFGDIFDRMLGEQLSKGQRNVLPSISENIIKVVDKLDIISSDIIAIRDTCCSDTAKILNDIYNNGIIIRGTNLSPSPTTLPTIPFISPVNFVNNQLNQQALNKAPSITQLQIQPYTLSNINVEGLNESLDELLEDLQEQKKQEEARYLITIPILTDLVKKIDASFSSMAKNFSTGISKRVQNVKTTTTDIFGYIRSHTFGQMAYTAGVSALTSIATVAATLAPKTGKFAYRNLMNLIGYKVADERKYIKIMQQIQEAEERGDIRKSQFLRERLIKLVEEVENKRYKDEILKAKILNKMKQNLPSELDEFETTFKELEAQRTASFRVTPEIYKRQLYRFFLNPYVMMGMVTLTGTLFQKFVHSSWFEKTITPWFTRLEEFSRKIFGNTVTDMFIKAINFLTQVIKDLATGVKIFISAVSVMRLLPGLTGGLSRSFSFMRGLSSSRFGAVSAFGKVGSVVSGVLGTVSGALSFIGPFVGVGFGLASILNAIQENPTGSIKAIHAFFDKLIKAVKNPETWKILGRILVDAIKGIVNLVFSGAKGLILSIFKRDKSTKGKWEEVNKVINDRVQKTTSLVTDKVTNAAEVLGKKISTGLLNSANVIDYYTKLSVKSISGYSEDQINEVLSLYKRGTELTKEQQNIISLYQKKQKDLTTAFKELQESPTGVFAQAGLSMVAWFTGGLKRFKSAGEALVYFTSQLYNVVSEKIVPTVKNIETNTEDDSRKKQDVTNLVNRIDKLITTIKQQNEESTPGKDLNDQQKNYVRLKFQFEKYPGFVSAKQAKALEETRNRMKTLSTAQLASGGLIAYGEIGEWMKSQKEINSQITKLSGTAKLKFNKRAINAFSNLAGLSSNKTSSIINFVLNAFRFKNKIDLGKILNNEFRLFFDAGKFTLALTKATEDYKKNKLSPIQFLELVGFYKHQLDTRIRATDLLNLGVPLTALSYFQSYLSQNETALPFSVQYYFNALSKIKSNPNDISYLTTPFLDLSFNDAYSKYIKPWQIFARTTMGEKVQVVPYNNYIRSVPIAKVEALIDKNKILESSDNPVLKSIHEVLYTSTIQNETENKQINSQPAVIQGGGVGGGGGGGEIGGKDIISPEVQPRGPHGGAVKFEDKVFEKVIKGLPLSEVEKRYVLSYTSNQRQQELKYGKYVSPNKEVSKHSIPKLLIIDTETYKYLKPDLKSMYKTAIPGIYYIMVKPLVNGPAIYVVKIDVKQVGDPSIVEYNPNSISYEVRQALMVINQIPQKERENVRSAGKAGAEEIKQKYGANTSVTQSSTSVSVPTHTNVSYNNSMNINVEGSGAALNYVLDDFTMRYLGE